MCQALMICPSKKIRAQAEVAQVQAEKSFAVQVVSALAALAWVAVAWQDHLYPLAYRRL